MTLLCDSGERYADTYCDDTWSTEHDLWPDGYAVVLEEFGASRSWPVAVAGVGPQPFGLDYERCDKLS